MFLVASAGNGFLTVDFVSRYMDHFPEPARDSQITYEASQTYLTSKKAPFRARALLKSAKIVIVLDDPVKRAYRHYEVGSVRYSVTSSPHALSWWRSRHQLQYLMVTSVLWPLVVTSVLWPLVVTSVLWPLVVTSLCYSGCGHHHQHHLGRYHCDHHDNYHHHWSLSALLLSSPSHSLASPPSSPQVESRHPPPRRHHRHRHHHHHRHHRRRHRHYHCHCHHQRHRHHHHHCYHHRHRSHNHRRHHHHHLIRFVTVWAHEPLVQRPTCSFAAPQHLAGKKDARLPPFGELLKVPHDSPLAPVRREILTAGQYADHIGRWMKYYDAKQVMSPPTRSPWLPSSLPLSLSAFMNTTFVSVAIPVIIVVVVNLRHCYRCRHLLPSSSGSFFYKTAGDIWLILSPPS